jgi:hypothetical protein
MALMKGKLLAGALFVGSLLSGGQIAPPAVVQQQASGGKLGRRRRTVRRLYPQAPLQLEMFPPEIPQTNIIPFMQTIRPLSVRNREEEYLLAA